MKIKPPPTNEHERELRELGFESVAGIDEVGRGALAGPVVAAAVLLPPGCLIDGVRDSKLVPEAKRDTLYEQIVRSAICWSVGIVCNREIDRINILQATFVAMRQAVAGLSRRPDYLLIDGHDSIDTPYPCSPVIGGDSLCHAIAAASILAKVTRDRMMREEHDRTPCYGFAQHKGYGTALHRTAILQHGLCSIHRVSFLGRVMGERDGKSEPQACRP